MVQIDDLVGRQVGWNLLGATLSACTLAPLQKNVQW